MISRLRPGYGTLPATVALLWTIVVGVGLLAIPVVSVSTSSTSSGGRTITGTSSETLLESQGAGILLLVLVPVALALVVVLVRGPRRRVIRLIVGITFLMLSLLASASIGLFYLPAAVALVVAGFRTARPAEPIEAGPFHPAPPMQGSPVG